METESLKRDVQASRYVVPAASDCTIMRVWMFVAVEAWVDVNAGTLRARATYGIRLFRKTPDRSLSPCRHVHTFGMHVIMHVSKY